MTPAISEKTISLEKRDQLQQLFAKGSQEMTKGNYEYANSLYFSACVLGDPGNLIYFKTFLTNLKKLHGGKKKKGVLSFLGSKKNIIASKEPEHVFKAGIKALLTDPWDVEALLSTGGACQDLGYHDVAVEYYRAAVESEPENINANMICGAALREIADYDGALVCVNRILTTKPTDHDALQLRNELTVEKTIHKGKYGSGDAQQVRAAHSKTDGGEDVMGRPLTYIEQVERRIKKNPNDLANYLELAQYFYQQRNFVKSEEFYVQAAQLSKNDPETVERLLDAQKQRLHQETLRLKEEFEANHQEASKVAFFKSRELFDTKNMELAQHRIKYHPNHAGFHYDYGFLLYNTGQVKEAIAEFQVAKAETTRSGDCLLALGQCFQQIKQNKLAMTHYQEAVEALEPGENKKRALYLAAKLAFALEDYEKSEKYGHQLAAIDFSYKDLGDLLDKVAEKRNN